MTDIKGNGVLQKLNGENEVAQAKKRPTTLKETIENRLWICGSVTVLYISNHYDISIEYATYLLDELVIEVPEISRIEVEYFWEGKR